MKRGKRRLFFIGCAALLLAACARPAEESAGSAKTTAAEAQTTAAAAAEAVLEEIRSAQRMDLSEAYEKVKDLTPQSEEDKKFVEQIKALNDCSGQFVQVSEETGNRYGATVAFYFINGQLQCSVDYSGYMGKLSDGTVTTTEEPDYLFESHPKGDLFGDEQDFQIYFGKSKLHILWGKSSDYTLTRGDGSVDFAQDHKPPFDETETYQKLISMIDQQYESYPHEISYDREKKAINIYFEAPEKTRAALELQRSDLLESWQNLSDAMAKLSQTLLDIVKIGDSASYVNIYFVDQLIHGNQYAADDYLLWIENGVEQYNYAKNSSSGASAPTTAAAPTETAGSRMEERRETRGSTGTDLRNATTGEQNALASAKNYLEFMAFSKSGLMEQLEYEGYSQTEASYAVEHCGADWNEQAVKKAQEYLEFMNFSRSGLIEQLEYEGFTSSQAEYGVSRAYN